MMLQAKGSKKGYESAELGSSVKKTVKRRSETRSTVVDASASAA